MLGGVLQRVTGCTSDRISRRFLSILNMECQLLCADHSHDPISLPNKQTVVVGRGPGTKIADKSLSRNQIELIADIKNQEVLVKQIGTNPCTAGGKKLKKHEKFTLGPGGKLCLLHDKYPHFIYFTKNDLNSSGEPLHKRQKCNELSDSESENDNEKVSRNNEQNFAGRGVKRKCSESSDNSPRKKGSGGFTTGKAEKSFWEEFDGGKLLVYTCQGLVARQKLAVFDVDGTLILTKSGKKWPVDEKDWKFLFPEIPSKLKKLHEDGFKVVMISNQNWVAKVPARRETFKIKIEDITNELRIPIQAFISMGNGIYRKPMTGMWKHLVDKANNGADVELDKCFFVGDAAGRPAGWAQSKKKDFSCSDRAFAANIGLEFHTPEEYFKNEKPAAFEWPSFDPRKLQGVQTHAVKYTSDSQEVIVLVGFPGCGKSTFAKEHLVSKSYIHVSRDNLGSWQKCVERCRTALSQGKSVVVDNTSPDVESRARYIKCAKEAKVSVRCFLLDVTLEHAKHNNRIREVTSKEHSKVPDMVFNKYKSMYTEPTVQEGFKEVLKIKFIPEFKESWMKQLYFQFS